ncbi:hypothetical protein HD598_002396 [Neomicrococcus aestuarii]|uniref:Uncharacterized protein n=1 Tax=Neomicrococcus aestuarii TaxID=556325 RepID=A0A7W8X2B1_9MICC|nr:hypothetical protein [Neomicrococcus aestuarii]
MDVYSSRPFFFFVSKVASGQKKSGEPRKL